MQSSEPLDAWVLDALRATSTATITTRLLAHGLRNTFLNGLRLLHPTAGRMVGEAVTLRYIPAREDIDVLSVFRDRDHPQRKVIEQVTPGQVLVIDSRGHSRAASLGNILATRLKVRGCAGIVTDGSVRDTAGFAKLDLPTFAAGSCAMTNLGLHHAVDLQVPIGCAEVAVYPGDIMVGDDDGVVCIPRQLAADVAREAAKQECVEAFILELIEEGAPLAGTYPPDDDVLARYGDWRNRQKS